MEVYVYHGTRVLVYRLFFIHSMHGNIWMRKEFYLSGQWNDGFRLFSYNMSFMSVCRLVMSFFYTLLNYCLGLS